MSVDDVIWPLAQLGSLPYQERYVINGTSEEFLMSEEILENVDSLRLKIDHAENQALFSDVQKAALQDLFDYIDSRSGDALGAKSRDEEAALIREGEVWNMLRLKATHMLARFGYDHALSVEEIDRLTA